jgi:hypothetical protein
MPTVDDQLIAYLARPKFSDPAAWLKRGLNPSSSDIQERMEATVNAVYQAARSSIQDGDTPAKVKKAVVSALRQAKAADFDTEEREWLCAEIASLGKVVGVSLAHELNSWLYGRALASMMKLSAAIKPAAKHLATYTTLCESCSAKLSAHATELQAQIPDGGWIVCSCDACSHLNLLRIGPQIKSMKNEGFKFVRHLSLEKYTHDTAIAELKALRASES